MGADSPLLFALIGVGVYLTRVVPLALALRREDHSQEIEESDDALGAMDGWLGFVGPSIIAALLVAAVLPEPGQDMWPELARTGAALAPTVAVAVLFENLGLTVVVGILSYGLTSVVI